MGAASRSRIADSHHGVNNLSRSSYMSVNRKSFLGLKKYLIASVFVLYIALEFFSLSE
jgi:hypothetical protein